MTTTMPEMETVVKLRNAEHVPTKIIIGGAAVTEKFAKEIGTDAYAKRRYGNCRIYKNFTD